MLKQFLHGTNEAGVDEAGRGCLCGDVFAAAVILPDNFVNEILNDSKKLSSSKRYKLREVIQREALAWAVARVSPAEIDRINILNASHRAMNLAVNKLSIEPTRLLIDGNRFGNECGIKHHCIIGGDALYASIAAASILAKTYRDDYMLALHEEFPNYGWNKNMGYPTREHREAIAKHGVTPYHRLTFGDCRPRLF